MIKLLIATAVFAHGVGHILFLMPALGVTRWADQTGHSWLLTSLLGDGATRVIAAVVWTSATVLFVASVVGLYTGADWWRAAAVAGAIVSGVGIIAMWDGLPVSNAFFALAFDAVVLITLLWVHWPSAEVAGS